MPVETLTETEIAVLIWMRANIKRLADTDSADCAVLVIGQADDAQAVIECLEDDHHGFRPLGPDAGVTAAPPHAEIRVWGSLTA